ncbi:hypothetical protein GCM10027290_39440 [Micromonospora sonneratiae]|uniref:M4 family metallopeptidase n=1 Tax=Micromonospora sonneratiae TaxID=1184706 RepID=A0ABW3YEK6_9ACTN
MRRISTALGSTALTAVLVAGTLATVAGPATAAPDPQSTAGEGTRAPALVSGIGERAPGGDAATAARDHLARNSGRYHVATDDLRVRNVTGDDRTETVRFVQRHRGVEVFGAHYLVHLTRTGTRTVTSVNGRYFTELGVSTTPRIGADVASRIARRGLDPQTRASVTVTDRGLTVLPTGGGVLTWRLTLRGVDTATQTPFVREVFVDAHAGTVALTYDTVNFAEGAVSTTGTDEHGRSVPVEAYQRADGRYELRDRSRAMYPTSGGEILTYDAEGRSYYDYLGELPPETPLMSADTIPFTGAPSTTGAVDAHYGAGQVYEFYRSRLGRDGLDGAGSPMISVVNVTNFGRPFNNAFWDGQKMVYGGATSTRYSFAADLDVVGHEMTHGVITNSADLVYRNQSGAMNEAIADYFGNAIDVTVTGTPMSHPDAGLLAEDLCKSGTPAQCALRNLNDGRTTYSDYLGVRTSTDNGGVHLNSTIFSGALWDIREKLDPLLADRLVYKALTEYMTPLDGFTDGRTAVLEAATALGFTVNQKAVVRAAFDGHGITPGWERELGVDSKTLLADVRHAAAALDAAGGRYVVSQAPTAESGATSIWTGATDGGKARQLSPADERTHEQPATDGRTGVWTGTAVVDGQLVVDVYQRALTGGPVTSLATVTGRNEDLSNPIVSGRTAAWTLFSYDLFESDVVVRRPDGSTVNLTPEVGTQGSWASLHGDVLAYAQIVQDATGWHYNPVVWNLRTGTKTVIPVGTERVFVKDVVVTADAVYWVHDTGIDGISAIKRAALDGTGVTDVVTEASGLARVPALDANSRYVTFTSQPSSQLTNAALPKLYQVPVRGGAPVRFSCNRGDQGVHASDENRRVVWLDGTTGYTNLVTRAQPAVTCD